MDEGLARPLSALRLRWSARFGFFLRAEAPVVGLGYPFPPRTAALGLLAAILGLEKDALAEELADTRVALLGAPPATHWHRCNLRKVKDMRFLPAQVSAKRPPKLSLPEETNTQTRQEWLINPHFELVVVPSAQHADSLHRRLRDGAFHFTPCMGLSEMLADVEFVGAETLSLLPEGTHEVRSLAREDEGSLDVEATLAGRLRVMSQRMPRAVDAARRFTHATYWCSGDDRPLPLKTARAYGSKTGPVMFL